MFTTRCKSFQMFPRFAATCLVICILYSLTFPSSLFQIFMNIAKYCSSLNFCQWWPLFRCLRQIAESAWKHLWTPASLLQTFGFVFMTWSNVRMMMIWKIFDIWPETEKTVAEERKHLVDDTFIVVLQNFFQVQQSAKWMGKSLLCAEKYKVFF